MIMTASNPPTAAALAPAMRAMLYFPTVSDNNNIIAMSCIILWSKTSTVIQNYTQQTVTSIEVRIIPVIFFTAWATVSGSNILGVCMDVQG